MLGVASIRLVFEESGAVVPVVLGKTVEWISFEDMYKEDLL